MKELNKKRILFVDDEPALLYVCAEFLELGGYDVTSIEHSCDALSTIKRKDFDVLITDLEMPEVHGLDIIHQVRKENKKIVIIALSGGARTDLNDNLNVAERIGADCSMQKPFRGIELVNKVNELMAMREPTSSN